MVVAIRTTLKNAVLRLITAGLLLVMTALSACEQAESPAAKPDTAVNTFSVSDHPTNEPIVLHGQDGVTLRGLTITADPAIELHNCQNITIIDCDLTRVVAGGGRNIRIVNSFIHDSNEEGVYLDDCAGVLVQGNRIERVKTGVLAHKSTEIRVVGNYCQNVQGPLPGGQFVQFDKVAGPGNTITHNYAVNDMGKSSPEDMISLYQSHGSETSPILVENNYLVGDPEKGSQGKSDSGSGIMLGDNGGSWQLCQNNTLISPGQVGIGVASGENILVSQNLILGQRSDVSNVGLYAWQQYEDQQAGTVTFRNNTVAWVSSTGEDNPYWDGGGFTQIINKNNLFGGQVLLD